MTHHGMKHTMAFLVALWLATLAAFAEASSPQWHDRHFSRTFVLPCGLARETAQNHPAAPSLPECPSLQGMGTGVIPLLEMLLQDYPDELVVLPCWPEDVGVDFTLYSPYAGRVEVHYSPGSILRVATRREVRVRTGVGSPALLQIKRLDPETDGLEKGPRSPQQDATK